MKKKLIGITALLLIAAILAGSLLALRIPSPKSQLDEEVELVTLDTLLGMVESNIPHKTAVPEK